MYGAIDVGAGLSALLGEGVQSIRLDSSLLPPMYLSGGDVAAMTGESGSAIDVGALLRPKLTITLASGTPIVYAPYGEPEAASWLPVISIAALSLFIAYKAGQRSAKR